MFLFQAQNKESGEYAALKQVEIKTEEDLEDFTVEIEILYDCQHKNVVGLHEAYFYGDMLWVRIFTFWFVFIRRASENLFTLYHELL